MPQETPQIKPLNPSADTYQPEGSQQDSKEIGDLHVAKTSHLAAPINSGMEFHMELSDLPASLNPKPNQTYLYSFPVVCTSVDDKSARFRQVATPTVEDRRVFGAVGPNDSDSDKPKSPNPNLQSALSGQSKSKQGMKEALGGSNSRPNR